MGGQRAEYLRYFLERSHTEAEHGCFTAKDESVKQQVETDCWRKERHENRPQKLIWWRREDISPTWSSLNEWALIAVRLAFYYCDMFAISSCAVFLWLSDFQRIHVIRYYCAWCDGNRILYVKSKHLLWKPSEKLDAVCICACRRVVLMQYVFFKISVSLLYKQHLSF